MHQSYINGCHDYVIRPEYWPIALPDIVTMGLGIKIPNALPSNSFSEATVEPVAISVAAIVIDFKRN
jgi:hypothetical protein